MDSLQATFEIALDFGHFFNIDMFQRGFYHVTIEFDDSPPSRSNIEVHLLNGKDEKGYLPAVVSNLKAVSKTVQILHRKQEVALDHSFVFRCHRLVDSQNIVNSISSMKFQLLAKLCFCKSDEITNVTLPDFEEVGRRILQLQIDPIQGLHGYTLLMFDYGFMAGIELICHASLVAMHQPVLQTLAVCQNTATANIETITLDTILFPNAPHLNTLAKQIQHAVNIHTSIVNTLYAIYTHLQKYLLAVSEKLPGSSKYSGEFAEALIKIINMETSLKEVNTKDELLDQVNMNLASSCSYVLALWSRILEVVCLNRNEISRLAFTYHKQRIIRFQSHVFTTNNPRFLYDDQRPNLYNTIASVIRSSKYSSNFLPLLVETLESDGVSHPLPVVFEDKFTFDCTAPPVFKQTFYPFSDTENRTFAPPDSASKNTLSGTNKDADKSTLDNAVAANAEWVSKGLSKLGTSSFFQSSASQFSQYLASHTLEEPDDLPNFNSRLLTSVTSIAPSKLLSNYTGPGYKVKSSSVGQLSNSQGADQLQSKNLDGSKTSTNATTSKSISPPHLSSQKSDKRFGNKEQDTTASSKKKFPEENISAPASNDGDLLTLEAFLDENFDFNLLHDAVCEPEGKLFLNHDCKTCHYYGEIESDISPSNSIFNQEEGLLQTLESKHAVEKSKLLNELQFPGYLCCDLPFTVPLSPYLNSPRRGSKSSQRITESHLIVLVHGLDGSADDVRTVRTFLQLGLEAVLKMSGQSKLHVDYLMSKANEKDTYDDIQLMTNKLVDEVLDHIKSNYFSKKEPNRISFIGHSLGGLLIRSAITSESLKHLRPRFYTFLTFSTPHLGTILNNSTLVNTGLWLMQKFKKSTCLRQLSCKEDSNLRNTFIYKLSLKKGLEFFKNILLVASADDRYVPYQSARIEMCKAASKDKALGSIYQEMIDNIMKPVLNNPDSTVLRYHVVHSLPTASANSIIGRAAHIAVLESEIFLEQFFLVIALQYFV